MSFMNKKIKAISIVTLIALIIVNFFTIKNKYAFIILGVILIFVLFGIFDESKPEAEKEVDENVLSDEEMEEELLSEGEFSYDNYDEVCCEKCGEYLGVDVTKCPSCGYSKIAEENDDSEDETCPNCGKPKDDGMSFCTYCDYEFNKKGE